MNDHRPHFNEHGATDCPQCFSTSRQRVLDSFHCYACGHDEPISANNGSVRVVESLQPIACGP